MYRLPNLNRAAVVVRLREPFLEWINQMEDVKRPFTLELIRREPHVYLIPEFADQNGLMAILEEVYDQIFESELAGWSNLESCWPKDRSFGVFLEWFETEWHSMLFDLVDEPLEYEDY